jgi:hypothetical protein
LYFSRPPNSMRARRSASGARKAGAFEVVGAELDVAELLVVEVGAEFRAVKECGETEGKMT